MFPKYYPNFKIHVFIGYIIIYEIDDNQIAGWWIYEYCVNSHVRQYHQEQKKVVAEFYLGSRPPQMPKNHYALKMNEQNPYESYAYVEFTNGTICDLTQQPRSVEIRFYCPQQNLDHQIIAVEEPLSCKYILKMTSKKLCKLPGFSKKENIVNTIKCVSDIEDDEEQGFTSISKFVNSADDLNIDPGKVVLKVLKQIKQY